MSNVKYQSGLLRSSNMSLPSGMIMNSLPYILKLLFEPFLYVFGTFNGS